MLVRCSAYCKDSVDISSWHALQGSQHSRGAGAVIILASQMGFRQVSLLFSNTQLQNWALNAGLPESEVHEFKLLCYFHFKLHFLFYFLQDLQLNGGYILGC